MSQASTSLPNLGRQDNFQDEAHQVHTGNAPDNDAEEACATGAEAQDSKLLQDDIKPQSPASGVDIDDAVVPTSSRQTDQQLEQQDETVAGLQQHATAAPTHNVPSAGPVGAPDHQINQRNRTAQLKQMKLVSELWPLCRQYGLLVAGAKSEVIQRVLDYESLTLPL